MIVGEQIISEPAHTSVDTTRQSRFSALPEIEWISGRDLLLADQPAGAAELPRRPRTSAQNMEVLWIPAGREREPVLHPIFMVARSSAGPIARVYSPHPVKFVPELNIIVADRCYRVLGDIGRLDASRLSRLKRRLKRGGKLSSTRLFPTAQPRIPPGGTAALPPAAATILSTVRSRPVGEVHVAELLKKGAEDLLRLLEERRLVVVLESGQVAAMSDIRELERKAAEIDLVDLPAQELADLWHVSVGTARRVRRLLTDLDSDEPRHYKDS